MKVAAILIDTGRELLFRRTILAYFGLVTLALLFFALALQTEVANGVIAELKIMGMQGRASPERFQLGGEGGPSGGVQAEAFVRWAQFGTAFLMYPLAILLSAFATASLVPRMLERGTIDLLLSKPISRPALFASRYLGGLLTAALNLMYLVGGLWAILGLKTGFWNGGLLLSGLAMTLYFACLLSFMVLIGLLFPSTTVTVMLTAALFFVGMIVGVPILPRTYEFGRMVAALILRQGRFDWGPILGSTASGAAALGVAVLYFSRKDF